MFLRIIYISENRPNRELIFVSKDTGHSGRRYCCTEMTTRVHLSAESHYKSNIKLLFHLIHLYAFFVECCYIYLVFNSGMFLKILHYKLLTFDAFTELLNNIQICSFEKCSLFLRLLLLMGIDTDKLERIRIYYLSSKQQFDL